MNEFIITFETQESAEIYERNNISEQFRKDAEKFQLFLESLDKENEIPINVTNGQPIFTFNNVQFTFTTDCKGRAILVSEENFIKSDESYKDVEFITLPKLDAQYIYRWMENYITMFGKTDIEVFGEPVSLAFERLYDRIAGTIYYNKNEPLDRYKKVCDRIPEDYKDSMIPITRVYIYKGESNAHFTQDTPYYVERFVDDFYNVKYITLDNSHNFTTVENINDFKLIDRNIKL